MKPITKLGIIVAPIVVLSLSSRFRQLIRQRMCALRGHQSMLNYDPERLSLKCAYCDFQTPGWEIGKKP